MLTVDEATRLARAVVGRAVRDAAEGDSRSVAWLASTRAIPWLDLLGIDQRYFLENSEWRAWARACEAHAPDEVRVITRTLALLSEPDH